MKVPLPKTGFGFSSYFVRVTIWFMYSFVDMVTYLRSDQFYFFVILIKIQIHFKTNFELKIMEEIPFWYSTRKCFKLFHYIGGINLMEKPRTIKTFAFTDCLAMFWIKNWITNRFLIRVISWKRYLNPWFHNIKMK